MMHNATRKLQQGFTLIELLIVIAVLGVLAAGVLVAINPGEQLARARDASRKTTVGQLSKAAQAYYTSQGGYPTATAGWLTTLVNAGEIKSIPGAISASGYSSCSTGAQNGFCYNPSGATEAVVYTRLESISEKTKGGCTSTTAGTEGTYFVWASDVSKAGLYCGTSEPTVGMAASSIK